MTTATRLRARVAAASDRLPLSALSPQARQELDAALGQAQDFDDLPGKWQAAVLQAERPGDGAPPSHGSCCH